MNERKGFDESFFPIRETVWKIISRYLYEKICHKFMKPQLLIRYISEGTLLPVPVPVPVHPPADTFWTRPVVRWDEWKGSNKTLRNGEYHIDYRHLTSQRYRLEMEMVHIPQLSTLIESQEFENHLLDITDVTGISASKSKTHDISDIDTFPLIRCREFVEPVTSDHLKQNMAHGEIRLDDMKFSDFTWAPRPIHWHNAGGSHHFAAARHQAVQLAIPVPIRGKLIRYSVDILSVLQLRQQWHLYLVPKREVFGSFF